MIGYGALRDLASSRSTASSRWHGAAVGSLCGFGLGAWEAGLLGSAHGEYLTATAESVLVVLAPVLVYAIGGWLLGLVVARALWMRVLSVIGLLILLRLRYDGVGFHAWPLVTGALVFLLCEYGSIRCARSVWLGPTLIAAALVVASIAFTQLARTPRDERAGAHSATAHASPNAPNVVLVTWDTVRGDSWPALGGKGLDTPALDALIHEGVLLENLRSVAPVTAPAHLSILSGLYPITHGLRSNGDAAPPNPSLRLPELLAARGYDTGAFVSNYSLQGRFGFERGFAAFADRPSPHPIARALALAWQGCVLLRRTLPARLSAAAYQTEGAVTLERALGWYAETRTPAFLWVHFYDAHFPYEPKEPYRARALARAAEGPAAADARSQQLRALQRGEIEQLDDLLARLRIGLEAKDPGLEHTLVVLVADHGECFGEGGILHAHHESLYDATQHIGGVVRLPSSDSNAPRGVRIGEPTSQIDFLPSLCAYLGVDPPAGLLGRSFLRTESMPASTPRGLYMETFQRELGAGRMHAWWEDGWKYVRTLTGAEHLLRMHDGQEIDVATAEPQKLAALRAQLDAFLATQHATASSERELSAQDNSALQALGYAGD